MNNELDLNSLFFTEALSYGEVIVKQQFALETKHSRDSLEPNHHCDLLLAWWNTVYIQKYAQCSCSVVFCYGLGLVDFNHIIQGYFTDIGDNHMFVRQPCRMWINGSHESSRNSQYQGMGSANESRCYIVTSALIGWAHIENDSEYHHNKAKHSKIVHVCHTI